MPTPLDRDFIEFARICAVARVHGAVGPIMMSKGVIDLVNVLPMYVWHHNDNGGAE